MGVDADNLICYSPFMNVPQMPIESVAVALRQGAGLARLRDDAGQEIPIIQVTNLEPSGLNSRDFPVETLDAAKAAPYFAKPNQVLLSQFASKLRAALVTEEIAKVGAVIGSNISVIVPDPQLVQATYLLALFSSQAFHARLERLTGGSTIAQVSVSSLRDILIPVPPMEQQEELAKAFRKALDTAQAAQRLVEAQQTLIEHRVLDLWEGRS